MAELATRGPPTHTAVRFEFFSNIARHVIYDHGITDRRWFIDYDGSSELPTLDRDCVVFIYGDERSLLPWRYRSAGLILKCMGYTAYRTEVWRASFAHALDHARIVRNRALNARIIRRLGAAARADLVARTLPFPLGYAKQPEVRFKPLDERGHLLWFSGSLRNVGGPALALMRRLADEPKFAARRRLIAALLRLKAAHPTWPIGVEPLESYAHSLKAPPGYAEGMMDTKIAPVPRGTTPETHRFFEAMRAGCVVVGEALPDFWFYRSAPYLCLLSWEALPALVEDLMAAPDRLQSLHEASVRWWREVCSPEALAATVAGILRGTDTVAAVKARPGAVSVSVPPGTGR